MLPIKLEIRNFLAYRAPDPVRFDGIHLACLTGSNGAGKSSLLDAITWALWGKARAKRDEEMIHLGQNDMYVQLDFEQEGTLYRVMRQRSRKSGGSGTLEFFNIGEDGELITLTEGSMKSTQARINRLLRLDHETFIHSAFLQQGRADAFTVKSPRERKQILSDILGLVRWETYEAQAKAEIRTIEDELTVHESDLRHIDAQIRREPHLRATLAEAETAQREAAAALDIAEASLAEVAGARAELFAAQAKLAEIEGRIQERNRDLNAAQAEIERLEQRIAEHEAMIAERSTIEAGYEALQAARQADMALGDLLMQLSDLDSRQHQLMRQLDAASAELAAELRALEGELAVLDETIASAQSADLEEVRGEVANLQVLEDWRERAQQTLDTYKDESTDLTATNRALQNEMNDIKARLTQLQKIETAVCPVCGQPLDEAHRLELIAEIETEGRQRGDLWRANKAQIEQRTEARKTLEAEMNTARETLARLPELNARIGKLQAGVDQAATASARHATVAARTETLRAALANDDYAHDVREQAAALREQRAALGYDGDRHSAARQDLETYRAYEERRTRLAIALDALPDAQTAMAGAQARRERLETAVVDEQHNREAADLEITRLKVLAEEQQKREAEVLKQRQSERSANQKLGAAQQELKALDDLRLRRVEVEARRDQRLQDQALIARLLEAFGKKGVPAMIIEAAIPELEQAANRLLARMTDGRMSLKLETQREKITGGTAETLDIQISDELGTRSYELYSGGEAFRINFALRVALSQMLTRRAGAHLRTLFIDEGFGTQDEDGRNKLVEAITAIQDDFDIILVVTHIDDLRDSFPVHLVVQKASDGSYVTLR
jgi:exonuclease SbcC